MKRLLAVLVLLLSIARPVLAEKWAFSVISDHTSVYPSYRNVLNEIRMQQVNPERSFPPYDFVLACGDLSPVEESYRIFREVFKSGKPAYFPVRGNHEPDSDVQFIRKQVLPLYGDRIKRQDERNLNYYTDWKDSRLIVLDQYSSFDKTLDGGTALKWIENALRTPNRIQHVFIAFHEPYLPQHAENDPFWSLLLKHRNKVRAVFAGHTHMHRMERFPDKLTGIYYVNTGNAGQKSHSDGRQTIVQVMVDGERVVVRIVQAPDGTREFRVVEQRELSPAGSPGPHNAVRFLPVFVKAGGNSIWHYAFP